MLNQFALSLLFGSLRSRGEIVGLIFRLADSAWELGKENVAQALVKLPRFRETATVDEMLELFAAAESLKVKLEAVLKK